MAEAKIQESQYITPFQRMISSCTGAFVTALFGKSVFAVKCLFIFYVVVVVLKVVAICCPVFTIIFSYYFLQALLYKCKNYYYYQGSV